MTTGKSNLIEISAEFRMTKGGGTAIFQGELDENDKEVWVWLPTSHRSKTTTTARSRCLSG